MLPPLYKKFALAYFVYYLFEGSFVPYWGLYLQHIHFSALDIGILLSSFQASRIIAPNFWGWITDRSGQHMRWICLNALLGVLGFAMVFWAHSFWSIFWIMTVLGVFTSSIIPLTESVTLAHLGINAHHSYGRIRVWGSLGFIVASTVLGLTIDNLSISSVPWFMLAVQTSFLFVILRIPEPQDSVKTYKNLDIWQVLKERSVVALLLGCILMVAAHGVLYNFYSIYLTQLNYSKSIIGMLWAIGVICEIMMFIAMPNIMRVLKLKSILLITMVLAVLRFSIIGWSGDSLGWLIFAQTLHAATFGSFHATAIEIIDKFFRGEHQSRGQTIYNSVTYGVGGTLGGLGGGYILQQWGGETAFMLAALCPLLGLVVIAFGLNLKNE